MEGKYGRLQEVGIWAQEDLCWLSFISRLWGGRTVMFKFSGLYYMADSKNMGVVFWGCGPGLVYLRAPVLGLLRGMYQ